MWSETYEVLVHVVMEAEKSQDITPAKAGDPGGLVVLAEDVRT